MLVKIGITWVSAESVRLLRISDSNQVRIDRSGREPCLYVKCKSKSAAFKEAERIAKVINRALKPSSKKE